MIRPVMVAAALALVPAWAAAEDRVFHFNDKRSRDTVSFVLDAPFERINGLSNTLHGEARVSGRKVSGTFRVPVRTIRTGNATRDDHLTNERWLDAARTPEVVFSFADLQLPADLEPGKPVKLTAQGEFLIRGIKRAEQVEITATLHPESAQTKFRAPGDLLHVRASFRIPIEQYGIKRTEALLLKVGDVAEVSVDAWGSTAFQPAGGTVSQGSTQ